MLRVGPRDHPASIRQRSACHIKAFAYQSERPPNVDGNRGSGVGQPVFLS